MNENSMTALISAFARAYHFQSGGSVFRDSIARELFSDGEYEQIAESMTKGVTYFAPNFCGSAGDALKFICEKYLCPSPTGRAAFCEDALCTAVKAGTEQYILLGAGYDTFSCRRPAWAKKLAVFELDRSDMLSDKQKRLKNAGIIPFGAHKYVPADLAGEWSAALVKAGFTSEKISFFSMAGLSYYISKAALEAVFEDISAISAKGSAIAFDYPAEGFFADKRAGKLSAMAAQAGEEMRQEYSLDEMERLLERHGFLVYENLTPEEITRRFFAPHTSAMTAAEGVCYCLAVKYR